jgi:outer membrane protein
MLRLALVLPLLAAVPVSADTLFEAIASAYATNPEVAAARAQLRQVDEGVPLATVGTRPAVDLSGSFRQELSDRFTDDGQVLSGGVALRQSIWEGGRIRANLSAAEARVEAARARLKAVENGVIVSTVTAYADVIRTGALVDLNEGQVKVLEQQLRASSDRFEVGDVTRTDVAQSEARLAFARANLVSARGQRVIAEQAYRRLVGRDPVGLAPLPPLPTVPPTAEDARSQAFANNPTLLATRLEERAALSDVRAAKAGRLPSVGVSATATYTHLAGGAFGVGGFGPSLGVNAAMPLFTGGLIAAQVRQAQARQSERLEEIAQTERRVGELSVDNWTLVRTGEAVIESAKVQVSANALAAEGVRQENQVGSRDILDVLNAEQELLNSRVNLVQAERDRYVAAFQLFETMGAIDPVLDATGTPRFDPTANSRRVAGMGWSEFGYNPDPRSDRARDLPPPAPVVGPVP